MVSNAVTLSGEGEDEVLQLSEWGVQSDEHRKLMSLLDKVNWEDLGIVRRLAEATSLREASKALGKSVNTVRARLDRLERALATTLFARTRNGLTITAEGRTVLRVANEMRLLSSALPLSRGNNVLVKEGEVGRVRQGGVISAVAVGHRQAALAVMCRG